MASVIYNSFLEDLNRGAIDPDTDTIKVMLVSASYTPDVDAHTKRSDITNEVVGAGYVAGGETVVVTVTKDLVNNRVDVTLGGKVWDPATITARRAVYYKSRGGAASADELLACIEFAQDVSSSGAAWTLTASILRFNNTAV
jgi:hypothetical protein